MNPSPENSENQQYQVVALKYRPQEFGSLIGQGHIATALSNAIKQNRVGHAYLFTGARGVGKTSSARIFAKCLNCEKGPTNTPCNECDICQAVSSGEDVDVLEIDGASNRGIDEIRQLRSNASVRPSRSKYKIYIIDEVHMLTMQAFNALLKTLEEPPLHVKFIFCTTDPQKIPITVLSRCQRFDFSPVQTNEIANSLKIIAESEGVKADEEALALLARRANGSMRDSQSLLEQLFSFCGEEITVEEVHQLLGTADMGRIANVASALANNDANAALTLINQGALDGVDSGQMAEQLLGYFRDMMAVRVGCGEDTLLNCTASDLEQLQSLAESLGLETILMIVQLLDAAVVRMQSSLHGRTLLEVAAIRICNLEKLDSIPDLVESLSKSGGGPRSSPRPNPSRKPRVEMRQVNSGKDAVKKNDELSAKAVSKEAVSKEAVSKETVAGVVASAAAVVGAVAGADQGGASVAIAASPTEQAPKAKVEPDSKLTSENGTAEVDSAMNAASARSSESTTSVTSASSVTAENLESVWKSVIERIDGVTKEMAASFESLDLKEPGHLVVTLENRVSKDVCSKADKKQAFENLLNEITGEAISVEFAASKNTVVRSAPAPKMSRPQQIRLLHENEFVKQAMSLFDAEIVEYHEPVPTKKR